MLKDYNMTVSGLVLGLFSKSNHSPSYFEEYNSEEATLAPHPHSHHLLSHTIHKLARFDSKPKRSVRADKEEMKRIQRHIQFTSMQGK